MNQLFKYLIMAGMMMILVVSGTNAQSYQLKKWVFGGGGMVAEKNSGGEQMSGILGQLAIEKLSQPGVGDQIDIYQGFWVPQADPGTSVTELPAGAELKNYPNPFSSSTTVEYSLPGVSRVSITIYDVSGKRIKDFDLGTQDGTRTLSWDAKDMSGTDVGSGSYMLEMNVEPATISGFSFNAFTMRAVMIIVR